MIKFTPAFAIIKKSFEIFGKKDNLLFLLKIYSPLGIFYIISLLLTFVTLGNSVIWALNFIFLLIVVFVNLAGIIAVMKILDGSALEVNGTFKEAASKYWKILLLTILICLTWVLGLVLLLIPFILAVTWFYFSKFIMVEKGTGVVKSMTESKNLVKGNFWQVFRRILVFGLFALFSQIAFAFLPYGIGIVIFNFCGGLFLLPSILLYREISQKGVVNG